MGVEGLWTALLLGEVAVFAESPTLPMRPQKPHQETGPTWGQKEAVLEHELPLPPPALLNMQ